MTGKFWLGLLFSGAAFAQTNTFTISNLSISGSTANQTDYTIPFAGSGTGSSSTGGTAGILINGTATRERGLNCGNALQMSITLTFNPSDSISLVLSASFTSSGSTLSVVNGSFNITGGTGIYSGRGGSGFAYITFTTAANNTFQASGSLGGTSTSQVVSAATVLPSGIVPVFSSVPIVERGSWISIYGTNLSNTTSLWNGSFPTALQGVSVTINNQPGYIWLVSPGQINLQVPDVANTDCISVVVTTPNGIVTTAVTLQNQQPSFSLLNGRYVVGEIPDPNGSGAYGAGSNSYDLMGPAGGFSFNTRPVKVGETIVLFGVGFGLTNPTVPSGINYTGASPTALLPIVTIGGVQAKVVFAGIVAAGLYQLNVVVPSVPSGDQAVIASIPAPNPLIFSADETQANVYVAVQ